MSAFVALVCAAPSPCFSLFAPDARLFHRLSMFCRPAVGNEDITADSSSVRGHAVPLVCSTQPDIRQRYMTACASQAEIRETRRVPRTESDMSHQQQNDFCKLSSRQNKSTLRFKDL